MITIVPYAEAGDIRFGMSQPELVELAEPSAVTRNRRGETVCRYPDKQVTLYNDQVVEVGFSDKADLCVDGVDVFGDKDAFRTLCERDGSPMEYVGFIILFKLGLTLTGFHDGLDEQRALTAFITGRWDDVRAEMRPYSPDRWQTWRL